MRIVRGHKGREKRVRIEGITSGEFFARLSESGGS